jgi:hypothetical protein
MLCEKQDFPTRIHSNEYASRIHTLHHYYIIFHKDFFLDDYTLYQATTSKKDDIQKIERLKKIKSLL